MMDLLSVLEPTADETALLAACLHQDRRAQDGWARWRAGRTVRGAEFCRELAAARTLLPLLARSVARQELDVDRDVLAYLRATVLRERLRAARFRQVTAEVVPALAHDGIAAFVVRGAALAATVYDDESHRHCHDLDLLVAPRDLAGAVHALVRTGCVHRPGADPVSGALLEHTSGLQVRVHTRPFDVRWYGTAVERFTRDPLSFSVEGVSMLAPSREASFVHVLGHATYSSSRRNLRWVTDAWHLLAADPPVDWDCIIDSIEAYRLTLPVSVLLAYIARFGMPIPPDVTAAAQLRAAAAGRVEADVALGGARRGPRGDLGSIWRSARSWRGRLRLARWVVAPSAGYMRSTFPLARVWQLPLCYAYRPLRFVADQFVHRSAPTSDRELG
jgi:hypothetical protein